MARNEALYDANGYLPDNAGLDGLIMRCRVSTMLEARGQTPFRLACSLTVPSIHHSSRRRAGQRGPGRTPERRALGWA